MEVNYISDEQIFETLREASILDLASLCLKSAEDKTMYMDPFHYILSDYLNRFYDRRENKLLISIPPQVGKSTLVLSLILKMLLVPNDGIRKHVFYTSYSDKLCRRQMRRVKNWCMNLFPDQVLDSGKNDAKEWELPNGSLLQMSSISGQATGNDIDILIVDDPYSGEKEQFSSLRRETIYDTYRGNWETRLQNDFRIILIQTRWHQYDLYGQLKEEDNDWTELSFPLKKTFVRRTFDIDQRKKDEYLSLDYMIGAWKNEEKRDLPIKEKLRLANIVYKDLQKKHPFNFHSLYQCSPTGQSTVIIQPSWIQEVTWEDIPETGYIIQSWDMRGGGKDRNSSFAVGQVWLYSKQNFYLVEQMRGQWDFATSLKNIIFMRDKYSASTIYVEGKADGKAIISALEDRGIHVEECLPTASKDIRLQTVSPLLERKRVFINTEMIYSDYNTLYKELITFPNSRFDDQVDALTQGLDKLSEIALL